MKNEMKYFYHSQTITNEICKWKKLSAPRADQRLARQRAEVGALSRANFPKVRRINPPIRVKIPVWVVGLQDRE